MPSEGKVASLFIEFRTNINQLAADLQKLSNDMRSFNSTVNAAQKSISDLGHLGNTVISNIGTDLGRLTSGFTTVNTYVGSTKQTVSDLGHIGHAAISEVTNDIGRLTAGISTANSHVGNFKQSVSDLGHMGRTAVNEVVNDLGRLTSGFTTANTYVASTRQTVSDLGHIGHAAIGEITNDLGRLTSGLSTANTHVGDLRQSISDLGHLGRQALNEVTSDLGKLTSGISTANTFRAGPTPGGGIDVGHLGGTAINKINSDLGGLTSGINTVNNFTASVQRASNSVSDLGHIGGAAIKGVNNDLGGLTSGISTLNTFTNTVRQTSTGISDLGHLGGTAAASMNRVTGSFGSQIRQISSQIREFDRVFYPIERRINSIGFALSAGFTAPLIGAGAVALKTGIDFETAFAGVRKTLNASEPVLAALRAELIQMSTQAPVTAAEFANIATTAAQLGITAPNIKVFAQTMAELGAATKLSATDAANFLARFTNITQLPPDKIHNLASTLVALGNKFPAIESEIANFSLRIAKVGSFVGLADADILAFATSLASVGVTAEAGGTAISRVFAEIGKQVESNGIKLQQFATVARIPVREFAELFKKDAAQAVFEFVKGLQRIHQEGGPVFGTLDALKLSNVRVRDTLLALAQGNEEVTKSLEIARAEFQKNGELTRIYAERNKTTASQLTIFKNNVDALSISLFDTFAPALNNTLIPALKRLVDEGLKPAVKAFQEMPEGTQHLIEGMVLAAAAAGPLLLVGTRLVSFFGGLGIILQRTVSFGGLAVVLKEIGAAASLAIGAGGLGGVIAALTAPLAVPWWLTAGFYTALVVEIYDLANAYDKLVTARDEANRAAAGSENAVFRAVSDFNKRMGVGTNIGPGQFEGITLAGKDTEKLRSQLTELGLAQQAAAKSAERMGVVQAETAKHAQNLGGASRKTAEELLEEDEAAQKLAKEHQNLLEKFTGELAPATALNKELEYLLQHFEASDVVAMYADQIVAAAESQWNHNRSVSGAIGVLYEQAKALETVKEKLKELKDIPVPTISFPSPGQLFKDLESQLLSLPTQGLKVPGNLDIFNRPLFENLDGTVSTIRSISVGFEELGEVLIPTVSLTGKMMTNLEAIAEFQRTGQHLGIFENVEAANAYADALHRQQEELGKLRAPNLITSNALKTFLDAKKQIEDLGGTIRRLNFLSPSQQIALLNKELDTAGDNAKAFKLSLDPAIKALIDQKKAAEDSAAQTEAWEKASNKGIETADAMASQIATTAEAIRRMQAAELDHNQILEILGGTIDEAAENIKTLKIDIEQLDPALAVFIRFRQAMNDAKDEASELEKEMSRVTAKIVNDLANGIAEALLGSRSIAEIGAKIGKDFAASFLRAVISGVVQPLVDKFAEMGKELGKILANFAKAHPIIAAIVGAALAAVAVIKALGNTHLLANQFVKETQNPFGKSLTEFVNGANALYAAGRQTYEGAQEAQAKVQEMWKSFLDDAAKFGEQGRKQATVAQQAIATLSPTMRRIFFEIQEQIEKLKPPSVRVVETGANLAAFRRTVAANTEEYIAELQAQATAIDEQIRQVQLQINAQEDMGGSTAELNAQLQELIYQWNAVRDAIDPVIPQIYTFAQAVSDVAGTLVPNKTLEFVRSVIDATSGVANLEEALQILEDVGTPASIIVDRLGGDIETLSAALVQAGLPIPDLISKYLVLSNTVESMSIKVLRGLINFSEAARAVAENLNPDKTLDFVDRVISATAGAANLEEALGILENADTPFKVIVDRLGSDIQDFANALTLAGLPIPPLIEKYLLLAQATQKASGEMPRIANSLSKLVGDAVSSIRNIAGGGDLAQSILDALSALLTGLPIHTPIVTPTPTPVQTQINITIEDNEVITNTLVFTDQIGRAEVRASILPEITEALNNNTDSTREKWIRILRSAWKGVVTQ